jgi:alpha-glucosidase
MVGETPYELGAKDAVSYLGSGSDELHLAFYFRFLMARWNAQVYRDRIDRLYRALPSGGWPCWVLNNHDVPRSIDRHAFPFEPAETRRVRAKAAAMILLTLWGTPFLYYGEELGMRNGRIPRKKIQDPLGRRYWPLYRGRDMSRTPAQWNHGTFAGFSAQEPWLPLNPDCREVNAEALLGRSDSLLSFYRSLLHLRKAEKALQYGSFEWTEGLPRTCLGYGRTLGAETLQVLINFSKSPVEFSFPGNRDASWETLLSTWPGPTPSRSRSGTLRMRGLEGQILRQTSGS